MNREKAVASNAALYGRAPRASRTSRTCWPCGIVTPDHLDAGASHSPILRMAAEAGKDAYVEKPMGNVLDELKAARAAVREGRGRIVQVGTQHRSEPYPRAA